MDRKGTRTIEVKHEDGSQAFCRGHTYAMLMEIAQPGDHPHNGNRGCDVCLFDLVGALDWDRTTTAVYETGEHQVAMSA